MKEARRIKKSSSGAEHVHGTNQTSSRLKSHTELNKEEEENEEDFVIGIPQKNAFA